MKRNFVRELVCPLSSDPFEVVTDSSSEEIESGELVCTGCGAQWPIRNGIPRLVPPDLVEQQSKTADSFGWQWRHFTEMHDEFEAQFLDWIDPLEPEFFRGKRILDAGCGIGRHAYYAASYGAREVVAVDLSAAVDTARENVERAGNVHVVQGDLLRLPFPPPTAGGGFDLIYSIGVLHHLPDPKDGFRKLVQHLRPGGTIAVWVYGYESNGFVRHVVEPLRRVSTRLPPSVLRGLAWPLAVGFHAAAKGIYRPLHSTGAGRVLPLDEYMTSVASFSFRQNYGIVFDQLAAPTAAYIKGAELDSWFAESGLLDVRVSHRHGNSWRGQGRVP
ncbi:MAG: methyltransferase domain-containing protein [Gaiellaceae bacterium]